MGGAAALSRGWVKGSRPRAATPETAPLASALLGVLVPETELPLGHIEVETVALLAAADAALVGGRPVTAVAELEHTGVPGQAQAVVADARPPAIPHLPAAGQAHLLRCLTQSLKHRAVHTCGRETRVSRGEGGRERGRGPPRMASWGIPPANEPSIFILVFIGKKPGPERFNDLTEVTQEEWSGDGAWVCLTSRPPLGMLPPCA